MYRAETIHLHDHTMTESQFIVFKQSYLTMLILNMAFMKDDLQEAFNFKEDIYTKKFSFMVAVDPKYEDYTIDKFISHISE